MEKSEGHFILFPWVRHPQPPTPTHKKAPMCCSCEKKILLRVNIKSTTERVNFLFLSLEPRPIPLPTVLPAEAVAMTGVPPLDTATSHTPSLWPAYSRTIRQDTESFLKLDTILDVWTLSLLAALTFCELGVPAVGRRTRTQLVNQRYWLPMFWCRS